MKSANPTGHASVYLYYNVGLYECFRFIIVMEMLVLTGHGFSKHVKMVLDLLLIIACNF